MPVERPLHALTPESDPYSLFMGIKTIPVKILYG
jgi:hypothetical protein